MDKKVVLDALGREMVVEENVPRPEPEKDNRLLRENLYPTIYLVIFPFLNSFNHPS